MLCMENKDCSTYTTTYLLTYLLIIGKDIIPIQTILLTSSIVSK
jgi:hypothetical protein